MFNRVTLKFSNKGVNEAIDVPAKGITVFVGPNNSGKSLVLREIDQLFEAGTNPGAFKILNDFDIEWPTADQISNDIEQLKDEHFPKDRISAGHVRIGQVAAGGSYQAMDIRPDHLLQIAKERNEANKRWLLVNFMRLFNVRLDGKTRFSLVDDRASGDLVGLPTNVLVKLFKNDPLREQVRNIVHDAFGKYFVLDPTNVGHLRIRLSERPPNSSHEEQSLDASARAFHGAATYIKDTSDGVQAFVGIMCALLSGSFRTIIIDEPEAFLHPPLVRKLGSHLATISKQNSGSLFAATHSPDFLIGCIQSGISVNIVRLEFRNGVSKGRIIEFDILKNLWSDPLIRSANVFSGLFYDGVIVTEADGDRVFYNEIHERLSNEKPTSPSVLVTNAQNKQTIRNVIGPLRKFGVPAAAIVDIDVIKDGGSVWTGWLRAIGIPEPMHGGLGNLRDAMVKEFEAEKKDMKKDGGISALSKVGHASGLELFGILKSYGLFVVPNGELESWLPELGIKGQKNDWVVAILHRMGTDKASPDYVHPGKNDVWGFVREIIQWIGNQGRKGID